MFGLYLKLNQPEKDQSAADQTRIKTNTNPIETGSFLEGKITHHHLLNNP